MILNPTGNLIRLLTIFCLCHVILALYEPTKIRRYPVVTNSQRSADSGYKYAWFTRDIHDDDDWNNEDEHPLNESAQRLLRLKLLKSIFNRKYSNQDENYFD